MSTLELLHALADRFAEDGNDVAYRLVLLILDLTE